MIPLFGDAMGERGAPTRGIIVDHIERSFAATVVFGFVVLVTGIILLAVL
jgi:hypothetical protein